jgi:hypothetical protein
MPWGGFVSSIVASIGWVIDGFEVIVSKGNGPEWKLESHRRTSEDHQTNTHLKIEINEQEHTASAIASQHSLNL